MISCKRLTAVVVTTHVKFGIRLVIICIPLIYEKLPDRNSRMHYPSMVLHHWCTRKPPIYTNRTLSNMKEIALMIKPPTVFPLEVSRKSAIQWYSI